MLPSQTAVLSLYFSCSKSLKHKVNHSLTVYLCVQLSFNLTLSLGGWAAEDWTTESMHTPESVHLYLLSSTAKCHHHYDSTWQTADIRIFTLCVSALLRWTEFLLSCTSWKALFLAIKSMKNYWPPWITKNEFLEIDDPRNIQHFWAQGHFVCNFRLWFLYTVALKREFWTYTHYFLKVWGR